jgi:hypothetical protein
VKPSAELDHWARLVEYYQEEACQLTLAGEPEYAAIFEKAIPSAIQQRERWRHVVLSGK